MTTSLPVPAIPAADVEQVHACLVDIITLLQGMTGQLQDRNQKAVTVQDLINLGIIDENSAKRLIEG